MKTIDNDTELKNLIKGIKLDSPGSDFTSKIMNRVYEEKPVVETVKDEKLLGKGFWIILFLFVALIAAMFITSSSGMQTEGQLSKLFDGVGEVAFSQGYQSLFSNLGSLPLSIGGILLATSALLFIDRFLGQIITHQSVHKSL